MFNRLELLERRYEELNKLVAQPEIATDRTRFQTLIQERASLENIAIKYGEYKAIIKSLAETKAMLDDTLEPEMIALVKQEINLLEQREKNHLEELKHFLLHKDIGERENVIVEIRAGTGGEEAALFAADLFRMYSRYAQGKGWQVEIIDRSPSATGGFKEIIFEVKGRKVFSHLKYERGVHRVQRVPITEASGRIHTSTATVAVLPEAKEIEVNIPPEELKIEFFRSRGAGGQNVNKVATAVRITHLPTGIVASCQDERSQLRNRTKAMTVLRTRVLDWQRQQQREKIIQARRSQVGSGDRAEKIRTYNFLQDRITDHRTGLTLHNLSRVLDGELDEIIKSLTDKELREQKDEDYL